MAFSVFISLGTAPASAQSEGVPVGTAMLDLYLAAEGFELEPPTATESQTRSVVSVATTHASFRIPWGEFEVPHDFVMTSDMVVTGWISSPTAAVYTDLDAQVLKGADVQARGDIGTAGTGAGTLLDADPLRFEIGIPTLGIEWSEGDTFILEFIFSGVAAGAESDAPLPLDAVIHFGSVEHPSRASVAIDQAGALPVVDGPATFYLAEDGLSAAAPAGEEDLSRATVPTDAEHNIASSSPWTWGALVTQNGMVLAGDSVFTGWITMDGTVGALRGFRATLEFDGDGVDRTIGVRTNVYQSVSAAPAVTRLSIGLNTAGLEVPAGTEIVLSLQVWSTSNDATGEIVMLYGSSAHPSGLTLPVAGAAGGGMGAGGDGDQDGGDGDGSVEDGNGTDEDGNATRGANGNGTSGSSGGNGTGTGGGGGDGSNGTGSGADGDSEADRARVKDVSEPIELPAPSFVAATIGLGLGVILLRRRQ